MVGKRLSVTSFHGLSLTTRYDSSIELNPTSSSATSLKEWRSSKTSIIDCVLRERRYHDPLAHFIAPHKLGISVVSNLITSTAEEKAFWIDENLKILAVGLIPYYIGCESCNKKVKSIDEGITFSCMNCGYKNVVTAKRFRLSAEISDLAIDFILFTNGLQKLMRLLEMSMPLDQIDCTGLNDHLKSVTIRVAIKVIPLNKQMSNEEMHSLLCICLPPPTLIEDSSHNEACASPAPNSKRKLVFSKDTKEPKEESSESNNRK